MSDEPPRRPFYVFDQEHGFIALDPRTKRTAYADPGSDTAAKAKWHPEAVAREMLKDYEGLPSSDTAELDDIQNWVRYRKVKAAFGDTFGRKPTTQL